MATIGLKDLYFAKVKEDAGSETYETPKMLAKAIKAELSVETAEAILYADDGVDEIIKEFKKGSIKLNINDLSPQISAELLGQKADDNGVIFSHENDEPPYVAIGFRAKKPGNKYRYVWLYKVKFAVPSENYETKGDAIVILTPEIEGQFIKRDDGNWKADYTGSEDDNVSKNWFSKVIQPSEGE